MFTGAAAAASDPLPGEGIGQALLTGREAAAAIVAGGRRFDLAAATYEEEVRRHLFADHRMSLVLGRLLRSHRMAEVALRAVGTNDWTRRNAGRWLFEDYPRALVATPRRWHRRMFTGPGAYRDRDFASDDVGLSRRPPEHA